MEPSNIDTRQAVRRQGCSPRRYRFNADAVPLRGGIFMWSELYLRWMLLAMPRLPIDFFAPIGYRNRLRGGPVARNSLSLIM